MKGRQRRTALGLAMVLVMIAAILVGCLAWSGSGTVQSGSQNQDQVGTPVDWRPEPSLSGGLQRFASYRELKDFLGTAPSYPGFLCYGISRSGSLSFGLANAGAEDSGSNYSRTNIQVEGVDEADIVKSDGEYIYLAIDNRLVIARAYPPERQA